MLSPSPVKTDELMQFRLIAGELSMLGTLPENSLQHRGRILSLPRLIAIARFQVFLSIALPVQGLGGPDGILIDWKIYLTLNSQVDIFPNLMRTNQRTFGSFKLGTFY